MTLVQTLEQAPHLAFTFWTKLTAVRTGIQVGNRSADDRGRSTVPADCGGRERTIPILGAITGQPAMVGQDNKCRQVVIETSQCISDPRSRRRKARSIKAVVCNTASPGYEPQIYDHVMHESHSSTTVPNRDTILLSGLPDSPYGSYGQMGPKPRDPSHSGKLRSVPQSR